MRKSPLLFLGTFPPRQCGIATFTADLLRAFDRQHACTSDVVAVDDVDGANYLYPKRVVARLRQCDRASYAATAEFINVHPSLALNIQHEYGIFSGIDGNWFMDLLKIIRKPTILTLHTVLPNPSSSHRFLARDLCSAVDRVVVLSRTAHDLLVDRYGIDGAHVSIIPHGIPDVAFVPTQQFRHLYGLEDRFVLSTFGLMSRSKGLETAIAAVAEVAATHPNVLYAILGETHPVVRRREGERYRQELQALVRQLGIEKNILMVDRYLDIEDLLLYLAASDVYVTPYASEGQVVSGTLAYAVGAGKPVVSTPYLYAREILAGGRGMIVPFTDSAAMAAAFRRLMADDAYREAVAQRAYAFGRHMTWDCVGRAYGSELAALLKRKAPSAPARSQLLTTR